MITQARLKELLHYDPETGIWTHLVARTNCKVGERAGYGSDKRGYWKSTIDGRKYYLHRLAFLYMTGEWPPADGEHENLDKSDCRWENLRGASRSQNMANKAISSRNKVGLKGVYRHKQNGTFIASIGVENRTVYIGSFSCPAAAHFAYIIKANEVYGEFARAR